METVRRRVRPLLGTLRFKLGVVAGAVAAGLAEYTAAGAGP